MLLTKTTGWFCSYLLRFEVQISITLQYFGANQTKSVCGFRIRKVTSQAVVSIKSMVAPGSGQKRDDVGSAIE